MKTILVIDDEPNIRFSIQEVFDQDDRLVLSYAAKRLVMGRDNP